MQNNIKVALIEHRTGTLSEIPASLNQSELGFAYDANRLFIGNPNNEELALRTTFPYQNVEILTEFSDLHNYALQASFPRQLASVPHICTNIGRLVSGSP